MLAMIRSAAHEAPEYSEEAIYRARTFTGPSSHKDRFAEITAEQRVRYFGSIEGPEASSGNPPLAQPVQVAPFRDHDDSEIDPSFEKLGLLEGLLSAIRDDDLTPEIDEAVEKGRTALASVPRNLLTSALYDSSGQILFVAFKRTKEIEYLNEGISTHPQVFGASVETRSALQDTSAVDLFGRLLLKKRGLLKERDNLISRIRAFPGFDNFLTSPSFDTFRSAASSGPVIIINHSRWRSDILILHYTSLSLIQTPHDFYDRTKALKDNLLDSRRKHGLDSGHYNEILASVLAEHYDFVGKPLIDRLHQLRVREQSRVWWCPTSVFCSLPLYAMGPILSDDGAVRYFLDLYICSYTPTLFALIQSRNRDSDSLSLDRPSVLIVAQPDPSLPTVGGEIQVVQRLDTYVTSFISEAATPAARPTSHSSPDSSFTGDKRLTLLDIVRSDLPTAEFAFLSACHIAEVTEGSVIDEGLHLAAAVQYCGFWRDDVGDGRRRRTGLGGTLLQGIVL
ncbi:hypothetical protein EDB86DRAFT_3150036 [Lactarius hatsudake]|nr:hypothetical protein EDB86DRAFT_3150036 [Lactarius hatsudake]